MKLMFTCSAGAGTSKELLISCARYFEFDIFHEVVKERVVLTGSPISPTFANFTCKYLV